jgi:hypothetical protein
MKTRLLSLVLLLPLLFTGCDNLFDEGDKEKTYDGPNQVAFFPLEENYDLNSGTTTAMVEVQLITGSSSGAGSDVTVTFSTGGTAVSGTHYNISSNSVTIPAGEFSTDVVVNFVPGSVGAGNEVLLTLTIDSANGAEVAENLKTSNIYIAE